MKKKFFFTILLIAGSTVLQFSCKKENNNVAPETEDKWVDLHAPNCGTPEYINFVNANSGCILGRSSNNGESGDVILKTNKGGKTWDSIFLPGSFLIGTFGSMLGGAYPDPDNPNGVYAAGNNGLFHSTDNGVHWEKTRINSKIQMTNMHFFDPANGISVGYGINKTADSGKTWQSVYKSDAFAFSFTMLQFTSRQTGYVAGGTAFDATNFGMMVKTMDGGNTWKQIDYRFHDITGMAFINDKVGYVLMNLTSSGIAGTPPFKDGYELDKTIDGGNTWLVVNKNIKKDYGGIGEKIFFRNELEGFSDGIYHTVDGSKTWRKEHVPAWICFPDNIIGYAAEMKVGGAILKRNL